jgi:hypothetical protein
MLYQLDLLVFDQSFISRVVWASPILYDLSRVSSIKFDLLMDELNMNGLVGRVDLMFYQSV